MNENIRIDFNRPVPVGKELEYIAQAVQSGHISGDGPFTKKCNALLEQELGVSKVLLTTSCTHALDMSAILLDIQPGDEVIIPDFTFVSTVNAFVLRGAKPVFIDVRADTLNLDESKLEALITPRTKAIVPVHYAGVGCEMDQITAIAYRMESKLSKITRMDCLENTKANILERSVRWRLNPSMRQKTLAAGKAAHC